MANPSSKLEPHREFIAAERRRKTTYRRIVELLAEKGVIVDHSTIHAFVKVRSKPRRRVITMLDSGSENTSDADISTPPVPDRTSGKAPVAKSQIEAIRRLKSAKPKDHRRPKGLSSFDPNAPLDRLSEAEARRGRDELDC